MRFLYPRSGEACFFCSTWCCGHWHSTRVGGDAVLPWVLDAADRIWAYPLPLVILCLSLYYLWLTRGLFFLRFGVVLRATVGDMCRFKAAREGRVSSLRAFLLSLGAMVGLGNVAGVATAITMGGPGALLWMWVMGLLAVNLNYGEVVLGITFRVKSSVLGEYLCTRSHVYEGGVRPKLLGRLMAWLSAGTIFLPPVSFLTQTQAVTGALSVAGPGWSEKWLAFIIGVTLLLVVGGELRSIARVSHILVTVMIVSYLVVAWYGIYQFPGNWYKPLQLVLRHAFAPLAAAGGLAGVTLRQAIRYGLARGAFTCNAGTGAAISSHAAADVDHPVRQGLWGGLEVIIDSIFICSTTGFLILASGEWMGGATAGELVALSFEKALPGFGALFAALCSLAFGWTSMLGMYYTSSKNFTYLMGNRNPRVMGWTYMYRLATFITILLAPTVRIDAIWAMQDLVTGLHVLLNIVAMVFLGQLVKHQTQEFMRLY